MLVKKKQVNFLKLDAHRNKLVISQGQKNPTKHCEIKGGLSGFNRLSQICSMFYQMLAASQNLLLAEQNLKAILMK